MHQGLQKDCKKIKHNTWSFDEAEKNGVKQNQ
jgi:hypothetical protein